MRKAFSQIASALHGNMPGPLLTRYQASVPLDPASIGFPTDESPANAWSLALERLLTDPDAPLPRISEG